MTSMRQAMLATALAIGTAFAGWQVQAQQQGGTVAITTTPEPSLITNALSSAPTTAEIATKIFDGLLEYDMDLNPVPSLATSWEISEDGKTVTFKLRDGVKWHDGEPFVNPQLAASQIRGGVIFGIGMALMEEAVRHPETGRVLTDNLADYAVPVHADIPDIDVLFTDRPDPHINELGVWGLGEIGLPGLAAAIGNALFNATGRPARAVPLHAGTLLAPRVVKRAEDLPPLAK